MHTQVLAAGTALAMLYNWIHIEFIQRTTSVFVAVAGNFKIVILIILSEVFVQDTHLPPWSIVGIGIVVLSFLGSFAEREVQRRDKVGTHMRAFIRSNNNNNNNNNNIFCSPPCC